MRTQTKSRTSHKTYTPVLFKTYPKLTQSLLITIIEKWQQADTKQYKYNIRNICRSQGVKWQYLMHDLNLTESHAKSILNPAHTARIEFLMALKLAKYLECDVRDFM